MVRLLVGIAINYTKNNIMINNGAISEKIKEYIVNESLEQKDVIQNDTLIFENNLLDSMGFLFLIEFLNTRFHIDIEDSELTEDNFRCHHSNPWPT